MTKNIFFILFACCSLSLSAQIKWANNPTQYFRQENGEIVRFELPAQTSEILVSKAQLTPAGQTTALKFRAFTFSADEQKVLIFTNTKKVWRYDTRGDYWVYDIKTKTLKQLGKSRPESSLMFAKFSPNGERVAYVSERNIYVEDMGSGRIQALTETGTNKKLINGTFDWVYEEEFDCRDGFRWSPDGLRIAFWQIDASRVRDFYMINTTDSTYAFNVPVEYPKVGELPSPYKIGVISLADGNINWMKLPTDPMGNYVPRMEWSSTGYDLFLQLLNRKQNESKLILCSAQTGIPKVVYTEKDEAWVDVKNDGAKGYWDWLSMGKQFAWTSEKDGWRHVYRISNDGQREAIITKGDFDVIDVARFETAGKWLYYMASPKNATQSYLYRVAIDGSTTPELISPAGQQGRHRYDISPDGKYAKHTFENHFTAAQSEWITLPEHKALTEKEAIPTVINAPDNGRVEFFQVTTEDGVTMDGWLVKPDNFDPNKKYPILFSVYTEPAGCTVRDNHGVNQNRLYDGDLAKDGYIYASLDGRGTPSPKGRAWRKAIYRKIGVVNIRDQAMGAKAMFKRWSWIDTERVAVHGWSGGGSTTLNLLFQYPDIYQTGIAVAAVANQLTYDNIYQERYMGIPQENKTDFLDGSPITHAKNLRGNLLYIHGTGDDNVHYQNAEMLVNELIKHNKQFQFMPYPNRSHGIYEGEGTSEHLQTLFTQYLRTHCKGGGK